jgi:hypothetical protein
MGKSWSDESNPKKPAAPHRARLSSPGIAVRRTASLPLAYDRATQQVVCMSACNMREWQQMQRPRMSLRSSGLRSLRSLITLRDEANYIVRLPAAEQGGVTQGRL